jgi:hypothetical protein
VFVERNALAPSQKEGRRFWTLDDCHWHDKVRPLWPSIFKTTLKIG